MSEMCNNRDIYGNCKLKSLKFRESLKGKSLREVPVMDIECAIKNGQYSCCKEYEEITDSGRIEMLGSTVFKLEQKINRLERELNHHISGHSETMPHWHWWK
jgi:predicted lipase